MPTLYETLGVARDCDPEALKAAYRKRALEFHPDKNPQGHEAFIAVYEAYRILSNSLNRIIYDQTLIGVREETDAEHTEALVLRMASTSVLDPTILPAASTEVVEISAPPVTANLTELFAVSHYECSLFLIECLNNPNLRVAVLNNNHIWKTYGIAALYQLLLSSYKKEGNNTRYDMNRYLFDRNILVANIESFIAACSEVADAALYFIKEYIWSLPVLTQLQFLRLYKIAPTLFCMRLKDWEDSFSLSDLVDINKHYPYGASEPLKSFLSERSKRILECHRIIEQFANEATVLKAFKEMNSFFPQDQIAHIIVYYNKLSIRLKPIVYPLLNEVNKSAPLSSAAHCSADEARELYEMLYISLYEAKNMSDAEVIISSVKSLNSENKRELFLNCMLSRKRFLKLLRKYKSLALLALELTVNRNAPILNQNDLAFVLEAHDFSATEEKMLCLDAQVILAELCLRALNPKDSSLESTTICPKVFDPDLFDRIKNEDNHEQTLVDCKRIVGQVMLDVYLYKSKVVPAQDKKNIVLFLYKTMNYLLDKQYLYGESIEFIKMQTPNIIKLLILFANDLGDDLIPRLLAQTVIRLSFRLNLHYQYDSFTTVFICAFLKKGFFLEERVPTGNKNALMRYHTTQFFLKLDLARKFHAFISELYQVFRAQKIIVTLDVGSKTPPEKATDFLRSLFRTLSVADHSQMYSDPLQDTYYRIIHPKNYLDDNKQVYQATLDLIETTLYIFSQNITTYDSTNAWIYQKIISLMNLRSFDRILEAILFSLCMINQEFGSLVITWANENYGAICLNSSLMKMATRFTEKASDEIRQYEAKRHMESHASTITYATIARYINLYGKPIENFVLSHPLLREKYRAGEALVDALSDSRQLYNAVGSMSSHDAKEELLRSIEKSLALDNLHNTNSKNIYNLFLQVQHHADIQNLISYYGDNINIITWMITAARAGNEYAKKIVEQWHQFLNTKEVQELFEIFVRHPKICDIFSYFSAASEGAVSRLIEKVTELSVIPAEHQAALLGLSLEETLTLIIEAIISVNRVTPQYIAQLSEIALIKFAKDLFATFQNTEECLSLARLVFGDLKKYNAFRQVQTELMYVGKVLNSECNNTTLETIVSLCIAHNLKFDTFQTLCHSPDLGQVEGAAELLEEYELEPLLKRILFFVDKIGNVLQSKFFKISDEQPDLLWWSGGKEEQYPNISRGWPFLVVELYRVHPFLLNRPRIIRLLATKPSNLRSVIRDFILEFRPATSPDDNSADNMACYISLLMILGIATLFDRNFFRSFNLTSHQIVVLMDALELMTTAGISLSDPKIIRKIRDNLKTSDDLAAATRLLANRGATVFHAQNIEALMLGGKNNIHVALLIALDYPDLPDRQTMAKLVEDMNDDLYSIQLGFRTSTRLPEPCNALLRLVTVGFSKDNIQNLIDYPHLLDFLKFLYATDPALYTGEIIHRVVTQGKHADIVHGACNILKTTEPSSLTVVSLNRFLQDPSTSLTLAQEMLKNAEDSKQQKKARRSASPF